MDATRGTYAQRSRYLKKIRDKYKGLTQKERDNTKDAKDLYKEIHALDAELKAINKSIGTTYNNRKYS